MNYIYTIQDSQFKENFPKLSRSYEILALAEFNILGSFIISKEIVKHIFQKTDLEGFWIESVKRFDVAKLQPKDLQGFATECVKRISNYTFDDNFFEQLNKAYSDVSGFLDAAVSINQVTNLQKITVKADNVKGTDNIIVELTKSILQDFDPEALYFKFKNAVNFFETNYDFLVTKSVQPEVSGYAYNFELINNLKDRYTIEATYGLSTLLDRKELIPDQYIWDTDEKKVTEKFLSKQEEMEILVNSEEKIKKIPISKNWQDKQKLDDKFINKIAEKVDFINDEITKLFKLKWVYESGKLYGLVLEDLGGLDPDYNLSHLANQSTENLSLSSSLNNDDENDLENLIDFDTEFQDAPVVEKDTSIFDNNFDNEFIDVERNVNGKFETKTMISDRDSLPLQTNKSAFQILYPNKSKTTSPRILINKDSPNTQPDLGLAENRLAYEKTDSVYQVLANNLERKVNNEDSDFPQPVEALDANEVFSENFAQAKENTTEFHESVLIEKIDNKEIPNSTKESTLPQKVEVAESTNTLRRPLKTATKVYLNLNGNDRLSVDEVIHSDGAFFSFDTESVDNEGLSIILSNNSQIYNPKPIVYKVSGLNKFINYSINIPFEIERQFNSVLSARNLDNNKNLFVVIPNIKTSEELVNIKRTMSSIGLRRSSNFKLYISIDNLAAFHNLSQIVGDGIDGIVVDLLELGKIAIGSNASGDAFTIYDIETLGIINFLKDTLKIAMSSKIPVIVNFSAVSGDNMSVNLKKIINIGIHGIIVSNIDLTEIKESIGKIEIENLVQKK
ncbi:hypothetical protein IPJ91_01425 [bacterium]|nr:MAG: hypothetical protein IPJ91_01425 [bacterium]